MRRIEKKSRVLQQTTFSPIVARRVGYYNNTGYNAVSVECYDYYDREAGYGTEPLSRAFRRAQYSGALGCLFYLNRR